jgi:aldehyde dehydrogenase (NAD+)
MIQTFGNLIHNEWRNTSGGATFPDENPADKGEVLGLFQASAPADVTAAIEAAAAAFPAWRRTPLVARQEGVDRFLALLQERGEELAGIVARENGKTLREARAEVQSALIEGRYHARQISRFTGHTLPMATPGMHGWLQYEPLGVIGIISPWNFPINVMCRKTLPALLTGNTVVFKPASFTPWSGIAMAGLFMQAGFPAGVFNCVTGLGSSIGNALVDDPRVRAISFTGSTEIGKGIQARAARNLTRTQLELGGKNALIVMADADLDEAAKAVCTAGFACAGQWCTSTSRILVQRPVYQDYVARLAALCEAMVVGDPLDERTQMGPVAGPSQYKTSCAAIRQALAEGARLRSGGVVEGDLGRKGYFVRPTLFDEVTPGMTLFREEVFGPVVAAMPFDTLEEALTLANDSVYGLSSGLFTRDLKTARTYVDRIDAGLAHVNIHTGFKDPSLPFGGWKDSGFGLPENGLTGFECFVNIKAVYLGAP